jgi:hypothetical protein
MKVSKNQALGGIKDQTMFEFVLTPNEFDRPFGVGIVFFKT